MKIGLVAMHTFPLPSPIHSGDIVILDLAIALTELGHEVTMMAPAGTQAPGRLLEMPASLGGSFPLAHEAEQRCWDEHREAILALDVVHDFSVTKRIVENMMWEDRVNYICTPMGGQWEAPRAVRPTSCLQSPYPLAPRNICVWSEAMRERGLRGATDYENTPTPDMAGPPGRPIKEAHVVAGGIDTGFYCPDPADPYRKGDYYLWCGRWHPVRGYKMAIDVARATGVQLVMAGENPSYMRWEQEKAWALEAVEYAKGLDNVTFEWLLPDPDHHTHKRELYRRAKAFLCTTQFHEPFGLSQVEAMSCGTPVIANDYGSMPEVSGPTGATVENSLEGFCAGIDWLCGGRPDRCRADAVNRFDRRVMARNYLAQYELVMAGKGWG